MNVLLFSDFGLPNSCANATRVLAFAKMLEDNGYRVKLLGVSYNKDEKLEGEYDDISYEMLKAPQYFGIHSIKRIKMLSNIIDEYLEKMQRSAGIHAIILSNVYYDYAKVFLNFSQKYGSKLIVNAVEWYEKNNEIFDGLTGKIKFIKNRIALKYIHPKMGNIIAISELLGDYYRMKGCNVCVIPTVLDMKKYKRVRHIQNNKIIISYAGSPARKDLIKNVIFALLKLDEVERNQIELHIYGATIKSLQSLGIADKEINALNDCLFAHGRIPYEQVKDRISTSDYTILLRPNLRYANAGFPTKVGESMACGTPVIANITSDLGKYIIDGENGVVCKDETLDSCVCALKKILHISNQKHQKMREKAKLKAELSFDYRIYRETIGDIIKY